MTKWMTLILALAVPACGGKSVTEESPAAPGSGGAAALGGAGGGGAQAPNGGASVGGGSSGGDTSTGGSAGQPCVPIGDGWSAVTNPTCDHLSVLAVSSPQVLDDDGDGVLSAGEGTTIQVSLDEIAGKGFSMYPGVIFESDDPGVLLTGGDWFYGIFACDSYVTTIHAEVASDVPAGTVVNITARVAMLNQECPAAPSLKIPLTIQ